MGRFLLRRFGPEMANPWEDLAFGGVVGLGALATLILGLGFLGALDRPFLALLLLASGVAARRELLGLPRLVGRVFAAPSGSEGSRGWLALALTFTWGVALFLLVFGLAPPADWDALMYHLQVPAAFLEEGRVFLPPDNLHATVTGVMHMLYVPLLAAGSPEAPALLNGLLALLLGGVVFQAGGRWFGKQASSLALVLLWGTTTLLLVAITARTDVTLALYLFLAHYALMRGMEEVEGDRDPLPWAILAVVVLGLAGGVKANALAYSLALSPLLLWILHLRGEGWRRVTRELLLCGVVGGAVLAPWLLKNLVIIGAPLYPFLAQRVAEPWLDALFPGGSAVDAVGMETLRLLRSVQEPYNLWDVFFVPARINVEFEGAYYFMNRGFLLLPLALLAPKRRLLGLWVAPALLYVALAVLLDVPNLRYLVPAVPALTVALAGTLTSVRERWAPGWVGVLGILVVCLFALLPTARTMARWVEVTRGPEYALGQISAEEYLESHPDPGVRRYASAVQRVNEMLPSESRLLLLFEARGFPLEPHVLQDNKISNWPILVAAMEPGGCLRGAGFDYVLVNTAAPLYYRSRGLEPEVLRWREFEGFRERCLDELWVGSGFALYRVREPGSG